MTRRVSRPARALLIVIRWDTHVSSDDASATVRSRTRRGTAPLSRSRRAGHARRSPGIATIRGRDTHDLTATYETNVHMRRHETAYLPYRNSPHHRDAAAGWTNSNTWRTRYNNAQQGSHTMGTRQVAALPGFRLAWRLCSDTPHALAALACLCGPHFPCMPIFHSNMFPSTVRRTNCFATLPAFAVRLDVPSADRVGALALTVLPLA